MIKERAAVDVWVAHVDSGTRRSAHIHTLTQSWLREVLAGYVGAEPSDIAIGTEAEGRPVLVAPRRRKLPSFSVSYSRGVVLVAVSTEHVVGVDVEHLGREIDWQEVARRLFSTVELAAIERCAPARRRSAFFECWVRKESYVKALGCGLRRTTDDFAVPLNCDGGFVHDRTDACARSWYVQALPLGNDYAAAIATNAGARAVISYEPLNGTTQ